LAQFHKWAEPLQDTISRVLAENLSALLHTEHIYTFPRRSTSEVDYQVVIQITRFDASPSGDATLDAHWQIMSGQDKEVLVMDKSHITNLPTSSGYPGTVSAMSENLSDLSRAIATSLNSLQRERR
jgi:hypothetical protein